MSLPDLWETARGIESPLFQGARELFAAKGGVLEYTAGRGLIISQPATRTEPAQSELTRS